LPDRGPVISVGDQVNGGVFSLVDEPFQDRGRGIIDGADRHPVREFFQRRFDSVPGAPIQVIFRVPAVSQVLGNGDDPLVLIVAESDYDVDGSRSKRVFPPHPPYGEEQKKREDPSQGKTII
jgi:hypothetical protein